MRRLKLLALLLLPATVNAQTTLLELQPGVRVRVTAPPALGSRYDATIGARHGDTLSLVRSGHASIDVPISSIAVAELYRGKDRVAGMWNGVKWGTAIGLVTGALFALGSNQENCFYEVCDPYNTVSDAEMVTWVSFGGAFYGGIIGAIVGRHRWERLQMPNERASLMFDQRGTATRVGLRFTF
jgi:hypothetical protein